MINITLRENYFLYITYIFKSFRIILIQTTCIYYLINFCIRFFNHFNRFHFYIRVTINLRKSWKIKVKCKQYTSAICDLVLELVEIYCILWEPQGDFCPTFSFSNEILCAHWYPMCFEHPRWRCTVICVTFDVGAYFYELHTLFGLDNKLLG